MKVKTINGSDVDLKQEILDNFKMQIKGHVLFPGENGYEDSRSLWNAMVENKPGMVVRCLGTADVISSIKFAREKNLLVCIKGGGHNIAGHASAEGGLMLDMSLMRGVWIDKKNKIAHAQAGCLLGDIDRETQLHGLATVLGFVSQTGIAGLTLGGGFGYLTRRWGWTADNVTGMDVVTAAGNLVHASPDENPDLFWGLRGGGSNFGIVTNIDYKLYPVGPEVWGGVVFWSASEAAKVLELYRNLSENAPEELTLVAIMRYAPPAPWIPQEWHGKFVIGLLACYSGKMEDGAKIAAQIKDFGKPIADNLIRRPYAQLQSLLDTGNPKGRRYYWKSEYLNEVSPALDKKFIEHAEKIISPFSAMILFQLGGALNKFEEEFTAAGNRNARYLINITSSWEKPEDDEKNIKFTRDAWNDLKHFSTGGTYVNFLTKEDSPERTNAALGKAFDRLVKIKSKWDPENFFRTNWNIKPAADPKLKFQSAEV